MANDPRCDDSAECHQAAEIAVKKVFAILGVDVDRPESVEEFREDLRFGRRMRRASDRGMLALIGVLATGLGIALLNGILSTLGKGGHG